MYTIKPIKATGSDSRTRASIAALRRLPQSSVVFAWSRARRPGRGASVVRARESVRGRGERFSRPHRRVVRARATSRARGEVARRGRAKANLARAAQPNRARTRDLGGGVRDERAVRRRERGGDARGKTVASIARERRRGERRGVRVIRTRHHPGPREGGSRRVRTPQFDGIFARFQTS